MPDKRKAAEELFNKEKQLERILKLASTGNNYFDNLPLDMVVNILSYLSYGNLIKMGLTSKFFYEKTKQSVDEFNSLYKRSAKNLVNFCFNADTTDSSDADETSYQYDYFNTDMEVQRTMLTLSENSIEL